MEEKKTAAQWLDTATAGIRFQPDRKAVQEELAAHLEDKTADFQRIFPDMTREEAEKRALGEMGDAGEVGRELARIHKPWLGYLWVASKWAAGLTLAAALLFWGPFLSRQGWERWEERGQEPNRGEYIDWCYFNGVDPYGESSPYADDWDPLSPVTRTPLMISEPDSAARAGDYRFRVEKAALWSFVDENTGGEEWWLFCNLGAAGWPWQPLGADAAWRIRGTDSLGNHYCSTYEVCEEGVRRGEDGYVVVNAVQRDQWPWEESLRVEVAQMPAGAEWFRLEYDFGGTQWSLTIPFDVEEGGNG